MVVLQELRECVKKADLLVKEIAKLEVELEKISVHDVQCIVLDYQNTLLMNHGLKAKVREEVGNFIHDEILAKRKELEELLSPYVAMQYVDTDSIFTYTRDGKEIAYKEWLNAIYGGK